MKEQTAESVCNEDMPCNPDHHTLPYAWWSPTIRPKTGGNLGELLAQRVHYGLLKVDLILWKHGQGCADESARQISELRSRAVPDDGRSVNYLEYVDYVWQLYRGSHHPAGIFITSPCNSALMDIYDRRDELLELEKAESGEE